MFDCPLQSQTWPISTSLTVREAFRLLWKTMVWAFDEASGVFNFTSHFVSYPTRTVTGSPHEGVTVTRALGSAQP